MGPLQLWGGGRLTCLGPFCDVNAKKLAPTPLLRLHRKRDERERRTNERARQKIQNTDFRGRLNVAYFKNISKIYHITSKYIFFCCRREAHFLSSKTGEQGRGRKLDPPLTPHFYEGFRGTPPPLPEAFFCPPKISPRNFDIPLGGGTLRGPEGLNDLIIALFRKALI